MHVSFPLSTNERDGVWDSHTWFSFVLCDEWFICSLKMEKPSTLSGWDCMVFNWKIICNNKNGWVKKNKVMDKNWYKMQLFLHAQIYFNITKMNSKLLVKENNWICKLRIYLAHWWQNGQEKRENQKTMSKRKQHTSSPILPFNEILIGLEWFVACINVVKWLMPISSSEDLRRPTDTPTFGNPWRSELERLNKISLSI